MQVTQTSVEIVSTDSEIVARVAAVDVGKDAGVVCVRTPRESRPGQRATRVWTVPARTAAITALAGELIELGVERIVLEGTVAFDDRTAGLGRVQSAACCQRQGVSSSNAVRTRSWTGRSAVIS
jgi:hypothetical protein